MVNGNTMEHPVGQSFCQCLGTVGGELTLFRETNKRLIPFPTYSLVSGFYQLIYWYTETEQRSSASEKVEEDDDAEDDKGATPPMMVREHTSVESECNCSLRSVVLLSIPFFCHKTIYFHPMLLQGDQNSFCGRSFLSTRRPHITRRVHITRCLH